MSLPRKQFGSVCHLVNGKAFKPTDWSTAGVPIIRIQNLNGADKPFNHWAGALDKQVRVKTGDLLLAWSGTPGTSFGAHIWSGPNGILNQHIFRCDLDEKAVTKEWARIAVNHRLHRLIEQAHGGVGLQHVTRGMVEELEIPLPPLAEQRRIAEVLDRAEALRAKRRAALAQLDSLTQSLFLDLFGNPIHNERKWPLVALRETCRVERGKFTPRPRGDPSYYGGRFPFIQTGDISSSGGRLNSWSQTLNEKGVSVSRSFPAGTVVIAIVGATLGMTAILDIEVYATDSVVGIQPHASKASAEYIEWVLRFWRPIFVAQAPETARANINLETLRPLQVPLPPIRLQREFARRVTAVEALKTAQRASLAELDALFATLQHRAFRGELFGVPYGVPPSGGRAHERKGA